MAANLIAIIPPLVIYFVAQKQLIGGIASVDSRGDGRPRTPRRDRRGRRHRRRGRPGHRDAAVHARRARPGSHRRLREPGAGSRLPPAVLRAADGSWNAYATQTITAEADDVNIQVARSEDLVTWEWLGEALP